MFIIMMKKEFSINGLLWSIRNYTKNITLQDLVEKEKNKIENDYSI